MCEIFDWIVSNLEIIISSFSLIATCVISCVTLKQTQKIHKQSMDIELYEKRKNLLDKVCDEKTDISIELELLFGENFSNAYKELKLNKNRISFLNDQMAYLESVFQEDEAIAEEYKDLCLRAEETDLTELYIFYDSHAITYYCHEIEDCFCANGKEILKELKELNKTVKKKEEQLKNKIVDFMNKTIKNK